MSVNATNPGSLFGGTWEQIQGRFLLAAGGGYSAGTTGGEASHKLTVSEMPSHTHSLFPYSGTAASNYSNFLSGAEAVGTATSKATGGNAAHNNMPPYVAVYIWKRTA